MSTRRGSHCSRSIFTGHNWCGSSLAVKIEAGDNEEAESHRLPCLTSEASNTKQTWPDACNMPRRGQAGVLHLLLSSQFLEIIRQSEQRRIIAMLVFVACRNDGSIQQCVKQEVVEGVCLPQDSSIVNLAQPLIGCVGLHSAELIKGQKSARLTINVCIHTLSLPSITATSSDRWSEKEDDVVLD